MACFLICAGSYVAPELAAEFGRLPTSFLPVANRRLFCFQREMIGAAADRILMSVPEDFAIPRQDADMLAALGIEPVPAPVDLTLGESVVYCINVGATGGGPLSILHGDTLIEGIDHSAGDVVSVGDTEDFYCWAGFEVAEDRITSISNILPDGHASRRVLSGYFNFSDTSQLVRCMTRARGDFVAGLDLYTKQIPLRPLETGRWLDFGHVHTFYRSRSRLTTPRAFNRLDVGRHVAAKSSSKHAKIQAEAAWYEGLPSLLRIFTPALVERGEGEKAGRYAIEYLYLSALSDLFVFGRLPNIVWQTIFAACAEFVEACAQYPAPPGGAAAANAMYLDKTLERLEDFAGTRGLDLHRPWLIDGHPVPSLWEVAQRAAAMVPPPRDGDLRVVHGDFCFSNIFYDFRTRRIRVIDPRGQDAHGRPTIYGDPRYDVAKLHHSVVGRYDVILAGYFDVRQPGSYALDLSLPDEQEHGGVESLFLADRFAGMSPRDPAVAAISVLLFLSMLPLHADSPARQTALLANALRLFRNLDR
ncbi:MAG TPA: phosphotransferase [Azospirillum sp.]|nr:phosphotransferase [Azospirillum sp.]